MTENKAPNLCLLMTGSELMSGDTIDSNSAYLGKKLADIGLAISEKITVGDDEAMLCAQLNRLTEQYDIILMNGGLGPTQDDLTAAILAKVCQCDLTVDKAAEAHIYAWCEKRGLIANEANLKQALLPNISTIFPDAPGSAPAFYLVHNKSLIIATPGVPSELRDITEKQLLGFLQQRFALQDSYHWQQYQLFGIGESSLQQLINEQFPQLSDYYHVGFRANSPYVELKLMAKADADTHQAKLQCDALLHALDDVIIGPAHSTLAKALIAELNRLGKTVSSAESCTGGLIASEITRIAGASSVFPGSVVSYSNAIKTALLQVPQSTLEAHGAVSEATVLAMLKGALNTLSSDFAIAVSGIAGPDGGSEEKPVGTVWIAYGSTQQQRALCLLIRQPRVEFQRMVSTIAMDLLRRQLMKLDENPRYLSRWKHPSNA